MEQANVEQANVEQANVEQANVEHTEPVEEVNIVNMDYFDPEYLEALKNKWTNHYGHITNFPFEVNGTTELYLFVGLPDYKNPYFHQDGTSITYEEKLNHCRDVFVEHYQYTENGFIGLARGYIKEAPEEELDFNNLSNNHADSFISLE